MDPILGNNPYGFAYFNVVATDIDPVSKVGRGTIFYQTILFDNRPEWQNPNMAYVNCGLATSAASYPFMTITEPISKFNQPLFSLNQNSQNYNWDILPRIKYYLKQCKGENVDLANWKISGAFFGNELANTANMTSEFIDPKITLSTNEPFTGDLNYDSKIDIFDYNILVSKFGNPYTIFDYNQLVANFGKSI